MSYAQTNIQLYNRLRRDGYSDEGIIRIHKAYELTMRLFAGQFRPSGKTFIAHLVGTASILGSLGPAIDLVAAGLLHAAYVQGDFGSDETGITDAKRKLVRDTVGEKVEEYLIRYTSFQWRSKSLPAIHESVETMGAIDRDVLLMRLANQLEDLLDFGILFSPAAEYRKKSMERYNHLVMDMANQLGFPSLAKELDRVAREIISANIPGSLRNETGLGRLRKPDEL